MELIKKPSLLTTQTQIATLFDDLSVFCEEQALITQDSSIVVGLSGGPDSIFLLQFLLELKKAGKIKTVIAAHLDHEWRDDSIQDVLFCRQLAKKYKVPFEAAKLSELQLSLKWNGSKEEIARKARRFFLESVMKKNNSDAIALGHHAQDQQETFFIRLLRGTSLSGLTAMKPKSGKYIRPLLHINKANIITYLNLQKIRFLDDSTNQSSAYLRNRIRNQVLPALKFADNRFDITFNQTLKKLQETEQWLDELAQKTLETIGSIEHGSIHIQIPLLLSQPAPMRERILIKWLCLENIPFTPSNALIEEITRFLRSPHGGAHEIHPKWTIKKSRQIAYLVNISKQ